MIGWGRVACPTIIIGAMKNLPLYAAGLLATSTMQAYAQSEASSPHPNILFILADDLGYADLSCYGNEYIKTPVIDQLAATGARFTRCYAGSAVSSPSRCTLMTGKHTGHSTIRDNFVQAGGIEGKKGEQTIRRMHLLESDTTIADVLRAAGYRTCLVNKWHLDGFNPEATPLNRGFDEFYGWLISTAHSNDPYYYPYYRFHGRELINITENEGGAHAIHNTDLSTDDAIRFIRRNQDNPFFLYLAYDAPHEPYNIDDTHWYAHTPWEANTQRYASLITHMDQAIGRVLAELDSLGLRDNTLVIFASDNGAARQAPRETLRCVGDLRGMKAQMYEGGLRVPFIVNMPGHVAPQTVDNRIWFPDVMPTLAHIADAEEYLPQNTDGMDIAPLFYDGKSSMDTDSRMLYWEFPGKQRAAIRGEWKAVSVKRNTPLELYLINTDPNETTNLATLYPALVAEMDSLMQLEHSLSPNFPE